MVYFNYCRHLGEFLFTQLITYVVLDMHSSNKTNKYGRTVLSVQWHFQTADLLDNICIFYSYQLENENNIFNIQSYS